MAVSFSEVMASLRGELDRVEAAIREHLRSDVALIGDIGGYLSGNGGKRVRPLLVLLSAKACGYEGERSITHSCVVEYIHTASLLHDDVVDGAEKRRGWPSANAKWGNEASVLVGDYLFAKSFALMSRDADPRILNAISQATTHLSEGEVLELVNLYNLSCSEEQYLDVVFRKTGALIEASCRVGAILGGASPAMEEALGAYGRQVGYAFQLVDDVLDYTADEARLGKPVGQDLREGKVTLPLLRLYQLASPEEKGRLRAAVLEAEGVGEEELAHLRNLMRACGAIEYTLDRASAYVKAAKGHLSAMGDSYYVDGLRALADYVVGRDS
ncbi:MAG: polyprenyl synthetase family protein [Nitrospinota bacterium]